jgi:KaiC/GvpD/RAD55 family RecA-like ATPase
MCVTSEQNGDEDTDAHFEENIADTVIRLGVNRTTSERYIEITKSRLQPERPGQHVFRITNQGMRIHPTPAGYLRQVLPPAGAVRQAEPLVSLGVDGLRDILGRNAIYDGDTIALHGLTGTSETILGLQFLRAAERTQDSSTYSLFIGDLSKSQMQHLVDESYQHESAGEQRPKSRVLTHPILPGLADPGEVLTTIQRRFETEAGKNRIIDRVLITNLSRWQLDMPRVGEDASFALALLTLLRRYGPTTILICGHSAEQPDSQLENLLLEMCDCVLELKRLEFRGQDRYYLQVVKSHGMTHRRGRFEMTVNDSCVRISPKESLIRLDVSGKAQPVHVVLFYTRKPRSTIYTISGWLAPCNLRSLRTYLSRLRRGVMIPRCGGLVPHPGWTRCRSCNLMNFSFRAARTGRLKADCTCFRCVWQKRC